jgi:CRP/FNR family transcriptional regulator, cyclic AMP receptor protein
MHSPYGLDLVESCRNCKLKADGFFCDLSPTALKAFEAIKYTTAYPEGAVLFVEGQPPRGVFMLCKGRVKLSITSSEGKTIILRLSQPGELLGLNAAVSGNPYQATAEMLEPCQVNFVKREDFLRLLRQHGDASIHAAEQLSSNYHIACDQIRSLGLSQSAPQKLARFLLDWSTKGQQTPQGIRVKLSLTHEEIGQIIGSSRETVTRTLGELKSSDLVSLHGSTLVIQNKPALESFVGS